MKVYFYIDIFWKTLLYHVLFKKSFKKYMFNSKVIKKLFACENYFLYYFATFYIIWISHLYVTESS